MLGGVCLFYIYDSLVLFTGFRPRSLVDSVDAARIKKRPRTDQRQPSPSMSDASHPSASPVSDLTSPLGLDMAQRFVSLASAHVAPSPQLTQPPTYQPSPTPTPYVSASEYELTQRSSTSAVASATAPSTEPPRRITRRSARDIQPDAASGAWKQDQPRRSS
jgi:hypothetical protein